MHNSQPNNVLHALVYKEVNQATPCASELGTFGPEPAMYSHVSLGELCSALML